MGREPVWARIVPLVFATVLGTGCTTRLINLAVREGGVDDAAVEREGAVADRGPDSPADVPTEAAQLEDARVTPDGPDGAAEAEFQRALDAGFVTEPAHYVQFTCCTRADARVCTEAWMGGADTCLDPGGWKQRAYNHCESLGADMTDYAPYGACVPTGAAP